MRQIEIQKLTLRNWRGEKERTTVFNLSAPTFIMGGNGRGKSRHFDAFCWLLFGKDSRDRKDFEVRSYDGRHNLLHRCECSVEGVLLVDGEQLTLKREYAEQWVKPRGRTEEVFSGNITLCTWNGTPVKVGEYQSRVSENIINETLFKMLTNPAYFTEIMKWKDQREMLLQMAGVKPDEEIAAGSEEFRKLLDLLSGKSLSDYRKEIAAEKKRLKAELSEITPRIDQTQKMMPEAEDWAVLEAQLKDISSHIDVLTGQIREHAGADEARVDEKISVSREIASLMERLQSLKDAQLQEATRLAGEANAGRRAVEDRLRISNGELSTLTIDCNRTKERIAYLGKQVRETEAQLEAMRSDWYKVSDCEYKGEDTCPHCGQRMPEDRLQAMRSIFESKKTADLDALNARGCELKKQLESFREELAGKEGEKKKLEEEIASKQSELDLLYKQFAGMPEKKADDFIYADTEKMTDVQNRITALEVKRKDLDAKTDDEVLKEIERKRDLYADERKALEQRLQKRTQIEAAEKEVERLEAAGRVLSQKIADIEQREYTADQFTKKKIDDCEKRINTMFETVKFQLFDFTQDGNEFECCTCLVGGVPYAAANHAARVNAGLDIIRSLCRFNNVAAPIFCDGSESVNAYIEMPSQMVFLKVTDDRELIIK